MSMAAMSVYEWNTLNWRAIEKSVFKLQKRIYQASRRGDVKTVHRLQRLLLHSWSAKCLAVRKVTQDNRGKKTAGIDGVKNLSPANRMRLVQILHLHAKAHPVRRVWIPKRGTTEKRGLGIPVMWDRATQALAKLALEPEWEARFEPNSYGFRPGRSAHDAMDAIYNAITKKPKFILDADIAKCFDRISHTALLEKLHTFPHLRRTIKGWLQAGVMDGHELFPTKEGTPQGGPLSPLLANIALHGLETAICSAFPRDKYVNGERLRWQPQVIRYADDFVGAHHALEAIKEVQRIATQWLRELGLELKPSKTRITHTLQPYEGNVGFDFLGWTVRQHPVGKTHSGKSNGQLLGFKTIITPSKAAQAEHQQALREKIQQEKTAIQAQLIHDLNKIITGWTNYHSAVASKRIFSRMRQQTYSKLRRWALHRHPNKNRTWVTERYWHPNSEGKWDFRVKDGPRLITHSEKAIRRHVKVQGTKSPYDGDWVYWSTRLGRYPLLTNAESALLKKQQGKCPWCGLRFQMGEIIEKDHILSRAHGGLDIPSNRQLLHGHCHDQKTTKCDKQEGEVFMSTNQIAEEPGAEKSASPVLKAGGQR
jgi:RNA-directed DNA polymerase